MAATSSRRRTGGGAAGAGGYSFAARVAAKLGVDIMASQHWPTRWWLPESVTLTALVLESADAVDDIRDIPLHR